MVVTYIIKSDKNYQFDNDKNHFCDVAVKKSL